MLKLPENMVNETQTHRTGRQDAPIVIQIVARYVATVYSQSQKRLCANKPVVLNSLVARVCIVLIMTKFTFFFFFF